MTMRWPCSASWGCPSAKRKVVAAGGIVALRLPVAPWRQLHASDDQRLIPLRRDCDGSEGNDREEQAETQVQRAPAQPLPAVRPLARISAQVRLLPDLLPRPGAQRDGPGRPQGQLVGETTMTMTDPVADMLTRIRNACGSKHRRVDVPLSRLKLEIARVLKENSYIQDYKVLEQERILRLILKYAQGGQPVIRELQRVSTPGLRKYVAVSELPRVRNGLGMAIVSTSKGVMTDREARQTRQGGELLAVVW